MKKYQNKIIILSILVVLAILSFMYFTPVLSGQKMLQHDIVQYRGGAQEMIQFRETTGEETYWSNSMFSGMPTFQSGAVYTANFLSKIDAFLRLGLPKPVDYFFVMFAGFFLLGMVWLKNWRYALLGALMFGLSTFFYISMSAGHNSKVHAIMYFAPLMAGIYLLYNKKYIWGFILSTLFLALQLNANHYQMTYYQLLSLLVFGAVVLGSAIIQKQKIKPILQSTGILAIAAILALSMNASKILSTYQYSKETTRGKSELTINTNKGEQPSNGLDKDYITQWSYGIGETFNLFIPRWYGGGNSEKGFEPKNFEGVQEEYQNAIMMRAGPTMDTLQALQQIFPEASPDQQLMIQQEIANKQEYLQNIEKEYQNTMGSFSGSYWGDQPGTSGPMYQGVICILLSLLALFFYRTKYTLWIVISVLFAMALSWGKNFSILTDVFIDYFPLYNKFRSVTFILVIAELLLPLLGVLGLYAFYTSDKPIQYKKKILLMLGGGVSLFLLIMYFFGDSFLAFANTNELTNMPDYVLEAIQQDRFEFFQSDVLRTLLFTLLLFVVLYISTIKLISSNWAVLILCLITVVDLWGVDKRYLNEENFTKARYVENPFPTEISSIMERDQKKNPVLQSIFRNAPMNKILQELAQKDTTTYRVLNTYNPFGENNTSYFHQSIGGYHGAKLSRYQDIIDVHLSEANPEVINMLNTKYVVLQVGEEEFTAQPNPDTNGNAWFVDEVQAVSTPDDEILALKEINTKKTAVANEKFNHQWKNKTFGQDTLATVKLVEYFPNKLTYTTQSASDQIAIFSEIYYPHGWKVSIDGNPAEYFNADYILRAMYIPKGKHTIVFSFEPEIVKQAGIVSIAGFFVFFIAAIVLLLRMYRSQQDAKKEEPTS